MTQTEYKGFVIAAYEARPGDWYARAMRKDGAPFTDPSTESRIEFIETPHAHRSVGDAILSAKAIIDGL